jgi:hypothetical protein
MRQQHPKKKRHQKSWLRWALWCLAGLLALLIVANAVMWLAYRERVLPNVRLGSLSLGNVSYSDVEGRVHDGQLLPETVTLNTPLKTVEVRTSELGAEVNIDESIGNLKSQRSWLPIIKLLRGSTVPVEISVNHAVYDKFVEGLTRDLNSPALPERVNFANANFVVAEPRQGYKVTPALSRDLVSSLQNGQQNMTVQTEILQPPAGNLDVAAAAQKLQQQIEKTSLTYIFGQHQKEIIVAEKGKWYEQDGQTMRPSKDKIRNYVQELAGQLQITAVNSSDIALATLSALENSRSSQFVVSADSAPKLTYCTNVRGVDESKLPEFTRRAAAILSDYRGWNANGKVAFINAENCDFTIWLASPGSMTSFGAICDAYYSCRVGDNVVINYDRWVGGTDPWNEAGNNIADYEVMVVNHEVGHRLGFGHSTCPGAGQAAPVMMQQSVNLAGCKFSPWPSAEEIKTFKATMGIAALPVREELLAHSSCCCANCSQTT